MTEPIMASGGLSQGPERQQILRQVPAPSPRQTVENFLTTTQAAENNIRSAIEKGLTEESWLYSASQRMQVEEAQRLLEQATQVLNLSEVPQALHLVTGVGTILMLRSLLLYDLDTHPSLVLPDANDVVRDKISSWTFPGSPITLAPNMRTSAKQVDSAALACQQCSEQDFLFTPHTVSQVESDFSQIFQNDPVLLRRFGGDLYINWSLTPGGDMPPKWIFRLPKGWKNMLLDKAYFGQSLSQWLIFTAASVLLIMVATLTVVGIRKQFRLVVKDLGPRVYWMRAVVFIPLLASVLFWHWFSLNWVNLTGDRALLVVVVARIMRTAIAIPLSYLLAEAFGQSLSLKRRRDADGQIQLYPRKGAGQLLTITRVVGIILAVTIFIQAARSLGLTSVTILALSSVPALAISLGTQQLIRDISDGFSLFLDGQLKVGDCCTIGSSKSGQIDGIVVTMGMRSIVLRLKNGSELTIPNSQVAASVVTNHSVRSAEPLDLRLVLPRLESKRLDQIKIRADELLLSSEGLTKTESHIDHSDGIWLLQVRGVWENSLTSLELSCRRDALLIALHSLIESTEHTSLDN